MNLPIFPPSDSPGSSFSELLRRVGLDPAQRLREAATQVDAGQIPHGTTILVIRYADFLAGRVVLRPHNVLFPLDLIEVGNSESPGDLLAGRVVLIVNEV